MDRPARPNDGSPARLIATMVGIVGILLLGSLAWSAVGALFSAVGEATGSLTGTGATPVRLTAIAVASTPRPTVDATPAARSLTATPAPAAVPSATAAPAVPSPTPVPTVAPTAVATDGRAPWILLPQPAPGTRITVGQTTIEARGRGDAPITTMRLELDGAALPTTLEQRGDSIWRAFASARVSPGQHAVRATITDDHGRSGGFRWTFEAN